MEVNRTDNVTVAHRHRRGGVPDWQRTDIRCPLETGNLHPEAKLINIYIHKEGK